MEVFMQVSSIMHKGVFTAQISDSIRKVAALMRREDIGSIPIYKNDRPVGFVTDRDIVISSIAQGHPIDNSISHSMTRQIVCIHEDDDVSEAARIMKANKISRLLVVDRGENPVGMLSIGDISQFIDDQELKSETITEIKRS
jgi:predicted transcriptional regulator